MLSLQPRHPGNMRADQPHRHGTVLPLVASVSISMPRHWPSSGPNVPEPYLHRWSGGGVLERCEERVGGGGNCGQLGGR